MDTVLIVLLWIAWWCIISGTLFATWILLSSAFDWHWEYTQRKNARKIKPKENTHESDQ